mmetsp:Transcript_15520/g.21913  ORF Transcript_15520/g.21913 Transcript_15520/m.21913 type:complete len:458 (-) Transcript_15520:189-1562(-)
MCIITLNKDSEQSFDLARQKQRSRALRILLCSESVPPQVNGIARRIGHYAEGLRKQGNYVELLSPECTGQVCKHTNPWNFTSLMMFILPHYMLELLQRRTSFDILHVVAPANISGILLLMLFRLIRTLSRESKPALVISWHVNLKDYIIAFGYPLLLPLFSMACWFLPRFADRLLTPTLSSDPDLCAFWDTKCGQSRAAVCKTGINLDDFNPKLKDGHWGKVWTERRECFLKKTNCKYLLLCVCRLSPEKSINDLMKVVPILKRHSCAVWIVGDGTERKYLERLAESLDVAAQFWGYLRGAELHCVYSFADLFVFPSKTETFGQTVNEALALECRVVLPAVPVFVEAYNEVMPRDAFWKPDSLYDMAKAIETQLDRKSRNDTAGKPNRNDLTTWDDACELLKEEYIQAEYDLQRINELRTMPLLDILAMPFLILLSMVIAFCVYVFSLVRTSCGGSV